MDENRWIHYVFVPFLLFAFVDIESENGMVNDIKKKNFVHFVFLASLSSPSQREVNRSFSGKYSTHIKLMLYVIIAIKCRTIYDMWREREKRKQSK